MNERIEKIKNHFHENKDRYLIGGCCTVVSGAVMFVHNYSPLIRWLCEFVPRTGIEPANIS